MSQWPTLCEPHRELGTLTQFGTAVVDESGTSLATVDPAVLDLLEIRALGHNPLLVRELKNVGPT